MHFENDLRLLPLRGLFFTLFIVLTQVVGCATYQDRVNQARSQLANGDIQKALDSLKSKADHKNERSGHPLYHFLQHTRNAKKGCRCCPLRKTIKKIIIIML
jgi:hypothetical protein